MQDSDTGKDAAFNVSIHRVLQYIAKILRIDLNNTSYIVIILKVQDRLLIWHCNRIGLKKYFERNILYYSRRAIYCCIVIFLGKYIDTFKFCIVPSLLMNQ